LVPTNANLAMVCICKLSQSKLQVGQLSGMAFARSCSCQDDCRIYYESAVID